MASEEEPDALKVYWDLFFKAETGTYEVSLSFRQRQSGICYGENIYTTTLVAHLLLKWSTIAPMRRERYLQSSDACIQLLCHHTRTPSSALRGAISAPWSPMAIGCTCYYLARNVNLCWCDQIVYVSSDFQLEIFQEQLSFARSVTISLVREP